MNITRHAFEQIKDPTGILVGDRYEFFLYIEVDEDDELFTENGLYLKAILAVDEQGSRIVQYQFFEETSNKPLDFALEDDEEELILSYCKQQLGATE
ncbi:DUF6509 family protein [Bacillus timonensis]|nr:DUF6509 family protein [Bacillus timonensis]